MVVDVSQCLKAPGISGRLHLATLHSTHKFMATSLNGWTSLRVLDHRRRRKYRMFIMSVPPGGECRLDGQAVRSKQWKK